jgi:N6-L-threonylcarbamoyladenine synthase
MINSNDFDFSFSGLKTAVLYAVRDATKNNNSTLSDDFKKGLAREFEEAVGDVIQSKLSKVISEKHVQSIIVGGGVSANNYLRELLKQIADKNNLPLYLSSRHISGDNALMIAIVGSMKELHKGEIVADGTKRI